MDYVLSTFRVVSVTFACLAVATGAYALWKPDAFAASFGLPLSPIFNNSDASESPNRQRTGTGAPYVALMVVRQLASGITLLTFEAQGKWTEVGTVLAILGILVATTDGFFLYRAGARMESVFHALPGALIAVLAGGVVYLNL